MVEVLVIPDGAAQPWRPGQVTALEAARTPVLDRLAAEGAVRRVATTPPGLAPGSEVGIPTLLGCPPTAPVGRGRVEAAAHAIAVPPGLVPWRADVTRPDGRRASSVQTCQVRAALGCVAHALGGHRLLLLCAARPADRQLLGLHVRVWDDGPGPSGRLAQATTLVCAQGAAAGCAALLGAEVVIPEGATGDLDSDLPAKARAAAQAIAAGVPRVVVHVGAPDEAAHRRDPQAVIGALARLDAELLAPLVDAVAVVGGRLAICPDHATDPRSGRHGGDPVPALVWGAGVAPSGPARLHERAAAAAEVVDSRWLLAASAPPARPASTRSAGAGAI